jgi:Ca2+-binding EF-hand superfamily protein
MGIRISRDPFLFLSTLLSCSSTDMEIRRIIGCSTKFHTGGQIMVSSIGSSGSYAMQAMQAMQQRQGPQDLFKKVDVDSSGGVSQAELKTLAEDINSKTGQSLKVDDTSFSSYDTDGSGTLSENEMMNLMKSNGFGPPGEMGGSGEMGTIPPSKDRAAAAYAANSGGDALSSLIAGLQKLLEQLQSGSGDQDGASSDTALVGNGGGNHGPQDFFEKVDSDGSGGISKDELTAMAEKMQKMTGQSISLDNETFAAADSDSDGSLNTDELKSFMDKSGFAPPPPPPGGMAMATSSDDSQAKSSSATGSSQKQIDLLKIMLEQLTKLSKEADPTASTSLLNVTA